MSTVLVTGGAGYIGSHVCKALAARGHLPVSYDNLVSGHRWAAKWGPLEVGDIADRARLDAVIAEHRPDSVMHFAAHMAVGESVSDPGKYYRNNVAGSLSLLEAMRDAGLGRIVFSSTAAVYGEPEATPIPEGHPLCPVNPYGRSKLMIEQMLGDFGAAHGLRSISLRYFNAAGADHDGEAGEAHDPENHLIPLVLDAALGRRPHIEIYGDDYDTPDGTCIRDYIHVADLAEAHLAALERLAGGGANGPLPAALNLGTGQGHSVREVIAAAARATGRDIPVRIAARRPGDPPSLVADPARARDALGWTARHAGLDEIVGTAARWAEAGPQAVVAPR
ncbi:MAG: UDP-glucose 4-epimerase GalE [Proteobacteria bacterium]|nr:UDP-glucose 4-epimerase GalE [Pseudomonadota bacterium]